MRVGCWTASLFCSRWAFDGESVRLGGPVMFVDELVDCHAEVEKLLVIAGNQKKLE